MDIDLKALRSAIAAEISRREYEHDAGRADPAEGALSPGRGLQDVVGAFEPVDLESCLPEAPPEPSPAPPTQDEARAEARARGLYHRIRNSFLGKYLGHPRVTGLLMRARQRPGGATLKNVAVLVLKAVLLRIPGLRRVVHILAALRRLPERLAGLEHLGAYLRSMGLQVQDQVNQGLYSHALAVQQNEAHLLRRIRYLEQELRRQRQIAAVSPEPSPGGESAAAPAAIPPDFYVAFEARFRGSREQIRERLAANLRHVRTLPALGRYPVLDIGCGRGEWLQLLAEEGIDAQGIDTNPDMVRTCNEMGLKVSQGDALEHLSQLPDASLAGLTALHVVEHVPTDVLIRLVDEALRVVRPGGLVLFETPNPENLIVGACNFYLDPTHRNPLPPAFLAFLLEARGFERVEIERRHPGDASLLGADPEIALPKAVADLLCGPLDYAAMGYVP
ncbi:MAG: class I SAM-dependent methyltransferase [Rhodocyclaceae bacterium]|nr:class I SAM-dependent methyltransferase [Rhodocyclaceae bacterium]